MNKEEILAKSRKENNNKDLYELQVQSEANSSGVLVATLLTTVFFILQSVINNKFDVGLYAIIFSMTTTNFTVRAIKLRKKWLIVLALICGSITAVLISIYLLNLFSK